jgi:hypothetical protein
MEALLKSKRLQFVAITAYVLSMAYIAWEMVK